jgi:hypothetical protein
LHKAHWSARMLTAEIGVGHRTVLRVQKEHASQVTIESACCEAPSCQRGDDEARIGVVLIMLGLADDRPLPASCLASDSGKSGPSRQTQDAHTWNSADTSPTRFASHYATSFKTAYPVSLSSTPG